MSQENSQTTYMIFSKKGRGVGLLVGPMLPSDIEGQLKEHFLDKNPVILAEDQFAERYPKRYFTHIQNFWVDKLFCYFRTNSNWIGDTTLSGIRGCCVHNMFHLWYNIDEDRNPYFSLNFSIQVDKFFAARIERDLRALNIFDIEIGESFYQSPLDGVVWPGNKAMQRLLAEYMVQNTCLS